MPANSRAASSVGAGDRVFDRAGTDRRSATCPEIVDSETLSRHEKGSLRRAPWREVSWHWPELARRPLLRRLASPRLARPALSAKRSRLVHDLEARHRSRGRAVAPAMSIVSSPAPWSALAARLGALSPRAGARAAAENPLREELRAETRLDIEGLILRGSGGM